MHESSNPSWEDHDSMAGHNYANENDDDCDSQSYSSSQWIHDPIVVAYAFGPKKLRSMGLVMAEASRVPVIHEEIADCEFAAPGQSLIGRTVDSEISHCQVTLTTSALRDLDPTGTQSSTIITLGNSNDSDLKHVVRYFRSSCSSAASRSETTVSTPTTIATGHSSKLSSSRFPVRISFVPVDPDTPLEEQHGGYFDLILHKLTEDILSCSLAANEDDGNKQGALRRVKSLKRYQELVNPSCCLVDDPARVKTLMSRAGIAMMLQRCLGTLKSASGVPVRAPKFVVVNTPVTEYEIQQQLEGAGLSSPLIVKPLVAAGTKQSHFMTIVLKEWALAKLSPGYIVQEYVNHNAALFKVYVLGENVFVYERPSLPNLPPRTELETPLEYIEFDSQSPYPRIYDFGISMHAAVNENMDCVATHARSPITADEVRPLAEGLRKAFGLELFGFDILVSQEEQEWLVVDVNYFPSYKEVPNFPSLLAHYLAQRVLKQRSMQS